MASQKNPEPDHHWHLEQFFVAFNRERLATYEIVSYSKPYVEFSELQERLLSVVTTDMNGDYTPSLHIVRCERAVCLEDYREES